MPAAPNRKSRKRRAARLVGVLSAVLAGVAPLAADAKPKLHTAGAPLTQTKTQTQAPDKRETVVEVSVLYASHEKKGQDPRIGEMPELKEAPFSAYASYELLSRNKLPLAKGGKRKLSLPNGRLLEARLEDILPDASVRLIASINRPGVSDFLPLLEVKARPGQSFIVAGQSYKRGMLVLVFKVLR